MMGHLAREEESCITLLPSTRFLCAGRHRRPFRVYFFCPDSATEGTEENSAEMRFHDKLALGNPAA